MHHDLGHGLMTLFQKLLLCESKELTDMLSFSPAVSKASSEDEGESEHLWRLGNRTMFAVSLWLASLIQGSRMGKMQDANFSTN